MRETAAVTWMQQLPVACAVARQSGETQEGTADYVFLAVNDAWAELTGMGTAVQGRRVADAFPELEASGTEWRRYFRQVQTQETAPPDLVWRGAYAYRMTAVADEGGRLMVTLRPAGEEDSGRLRFALMRHTLQSIHDGVILLDGRGTVIGCNRAAAEITGWGEEPVTGLPCARVLPLRDADDLVAEALRTGRMIPLGGKVELTGRPGAAVPVVGALLPLRGADGRVAGVSAVFRNAAREREQQDAILYLSYHDYLTGLYNRRFGDEEIHRLDVPRQLPLAVIMGDVNGLKISNDVFGHETGDRILREAAEAIRRSCRAEDIVSRWGGDEFLVLLPQTGAVTAEHIVRRIQARCSQHKVGSMPLSISLGCAVKTADTENFSHILRVAEEKMYHQKLVESRKYRTAVLRGLLKALPEKSCESDAHVERLKRSCAAMADAIGLPQESRVDLETLAALHDVGQVAVSRDILCKPGPLGREEWVEVHRHPEIGYRIAHSATELSTVAESILCHHERWDGSGYPRGLSKENIPLISRAFAVADAFDAMTHDRPYRRAMGGRQAVRELQNGAGTQFDPEMVRVFCRLWEGQPPDSRAG